MDGLSGVSPSKPQRIIPGIFGQPAESEAFQPIQSNMPELLAEAVCPRWTHGLPTDLYYLTLSGMYLNIVCTSITLELVAQCIKNTHVHEIENMVWIIDKYILKTIKFQWANTIRKFILE